MCCCYLDRYFLQTGPGCIKWSAPSVWDPKTMWCNKTCADTQVLQSWISKTTTTDVGLRHRAHWCGSNSPEHKCSFMPEQCVKSLYRITYWKILGVSASVLKLHSLQWDASPEALEHANKRSVATKDTVHCQAQGMKSVQETESNQLYCLQKCSW